MLIKLNCIRAGGSKIDLGGKIYHFAPNNHGDHVCDVVDKDAIKRFLSIDAYEVYEGPAPKAVASIPPPEPEIKPVAPEPSAVKQVDVTDTYDAMDRDALAAAIKSRTGKEPHHRTSDANLRTALRELDFAETEPVAKTA